MSATDAGILARGAEATVRHAQFLERPVVVKHRTPKSYRHPALDARLRGQRTRDEAALLAAARKAGVRVPVMLDVDRASAALSLEYVPHPSLRDVLEDAGVEEACALLGHLGRMTAQLHEAGLTHGDLTTSNVLVAARPHGPRGQADLVLIDFGLGSFAMDDEDRGVDLHLVEEALEATHERAAHLFDAFITAYSSWPGAKPVLQRLDDIRERGRYR